jgi:hypothetical protein
MIATSVVRFHRFLVLVVGVLCATPSLAASVVLVKSANPAPGMSEALVRIHGELMSAGFEVEVVPGLVVEGSDGDSRSWLELLAARRGADAVVAMMGDKSPDSVEVWVIDKVTGKSVVRHVPFRPLSAKGPETLAIQAVELLRASFLEIGLTSMAQASQARSAPPSTVVHFVEMDRKNPRPERFDVEVGGAASMSLDGVGPAVMPVVRLGWAVRPWFIVQATAAGMGNRPSVASLAGSSQVAQSFAALGASYRFWADRRLRPFVALSAGVLHTAVEGRADVPWQGQNVAQSSFLFDGEVGVGVPLPDRFYLSLAAHVQMAEPYPAIRFANAVVATSAHPNLLLTLTLGVWL